MRPTREDPNGGKGKDLHDIKGQTGERGQRQSGWRNRRRTLADQAPDSLLQPGLPDLASLNPL